MAIPVYPSAVEGQRVPLTGRQPGDVGYGGLGPAVHPQAGVDLIGPGPEVVHDRQVDGMVARREVGAREGGVVAEVALDVGAPMVAGYLTVGIIP